MSFDRAVQATPQRVGDVILLPAGLRVSRQVWEEAPPEDQEALLEMTAEEVWEQWARW